MKGFEFFEKKMMENWEQREGRALEVISEGLCRYAEESCSFRKKKRGCH